jgi:aminoglycoside 6'-N-acetyltransferase I
MPEHNVQIRPAQSSDLDQLARLFEALWPQTPSDEHMQELRLILGGKTAAVLTMPLTIFVAERSDGILVGFVEVDLRSHADGCNPAQPVGYIEGWYVAEHQRHRGIGRKLIAKAEDWARSHSCVEIASDALIDNQLSQQAHGALGYEIVDRCVHYRKKL